SLDVQASTESITTATEQASDGSAGDNGEASEQAMKKQRSRKMKPPARWVRIYLAPGRYEHTGIYFFKTFARVEIIGEEVEERENEYEPHEEGWIGTKQTAITTSIENDESQNQRENANDEAEADNDASEGSHSGRSSLTNSLRGII